MSLTLNTNIRNDLDSYLLDSKNVKGTYNLVSIVPSLIGDGSSIDSIYTMIDGSLVQIY